MEPHEEPFISSTLLWKLVINVMLRWNLDLGLTSRMVTNLNILVDMVWISMATAKGSSLLRCHDSLAH